MEDTNQIVPTNSQMPVTAMPELGRGHEDALEQSDFEIPRAKVVQFTSEEATAADEADRIPPGRFINGVSKKEIPPVFIPIFRYKTYTHWNPRKKDDPNYDPAYDVGALIFSTQDRHDPRVTATRIVQNRDGDDVEIDGLAFGPNGEAPLITESFNFLCLFEGQAFPMLLSFQKTSMRAGKILNTMLLEAGGDMFSNKFKLVFTQGENNGTKYYIMNVRAQGKATAQEHATALGWFNRFKGQNIEAKVQKEQTFTE